MKTISKISIIFLIIVGMFSCELPDNVDPKSPRQVPTEALFTNAQRYLGDYIGTMNYNIQVNHFLVRYWTEVTYLTEVRYDFADRSIPDTWWDVMYRNVLTDFEEAKKQVNNTTFANEAKKKNQLAMIDISQVYAWHVLVETFGNIPYSEALDPDNSTPAYDDAETIYRDLISRLTTNIGRLTSGEPSFGDNDLFFNGDPDMWRKFAASLKFRMAMRLADYDKTYSVEQANAALSTGVFEEGEGAIFQFTSTPPHVHSIYQWFEIDGRTDVVPTKPFVDSLASLNDPRMKYLVDTSFGPPQPYAIQVNKYAEVAHFQKQFFEPNFENVFTDYAEMEFLKAEAAARGGYNVSGTAEAHYENAIEASIRYWAHNYEKFTGETISESDLQTKVNDYLAQDAVQYDANNWKKSIGIQKWIALYNRPTESWASWRVLEHPQFDFTEDMGTLYQQVPVRYPYPFSESRLNTSNYNSAVEAMGGEDSPTVNLFWDVE